MNKPPNRRRRASAPQGATPGDRREGVGLLRVRGPRWGRVGVDVVAALAVLSLFVAASVSAVAVSVMALVLLGLVIPRVAGVPAVLQLATGAALLAAAWASVLGGYQTTAWLDVVAHVVVTGLLAAVLTDVLLRAGLVVPAAGPRRAASLVLLTLGAGLSLAVVWELGEWFGHTVIDSGIGVGYDDTIGDLAAGGLGAAVAGLGLARGSRS